MKIISFLLYNVFIYPLMRFASFLASGLNEKIRAGIAGRKQTIRRLEAWNPERNNWEKIILFHCASLGEYEQIKPILKLVSKEHPEIGLAVSFFSPSGYDHMGDNPDVDLKLYLPPDSLFSLRRFLNLLRPNLVVISKHDVWPNFIWSLASRNIPVVLINGTLPKDSMLTWPLFRSFYRSIFREFQFVAPASKEDEQGFRKITGDAVPLEIMGDTRFDQVLIRAREAAKRKLLPHSFFSDKITIVAGSIWPSDEEHLFPAFEKLLQQFPNLYLLLVPHEPSKEHLEQIGKFLQGQQVPFVHLSELKTENRINGTRALLVDRIGVLANLYGFGDVAYVGGSFGPGVHNVMEPAAHKLPVLFGPKILNSPEARALVELGAGFRVNAWQEAYRTLEALCNSEEKRKECGQTAYRFILTNQGATARIVKKLIGLL